MFLKRLEIAGFKSFATHTTFLFEPGLTAIVGPNGSGKSNVTDALRWVFGEQKQSLLRGKKADDVIFAGSDKKTKLGLAQVTAVFDNADRKMPLDAPEVALTRRVDRGGNSSYLINGGTVRLQDLAELILQSGIGTSQTAVISQGTVEQLVAGSPLELKNLFDEASGVKIYYVRRAKAWRRLEQTKENLVKAFEKLKETEPRLRLLRRQVEKYNQRSTLEATLINLQTLWFTHKAIDLFSKLQTVNTRLEEENYKKQQFIEQIQSLQKKIAEAGIVQSGIYKQLTDLRTKETEVREVRHQLQEQRAVLLSQLEFAKNGDGSRQVQIINRGSALKSKFTDISQKILKEGETIHRLKNETIELGRRLGEVQASLQKIQNESLLSNASFVEIARQIDTLTEQVTTLETSVLSATELSSAQQTVQRFIHEFKAFYQRSRKLVLPYVQTNENAQIEPEEEQKIAQISKELADKTTLLEKSQMIKSWLEKELSEVQSELTNLQNTLLVANGNDEEISAKIKKIDIEIDATAPTLTQLQQDQNATTEKDEEMRKAIRTDEQVIHLKQNELEKLRITATDILMEKTRLDTLLEQVKDSAVSALGTEAWENIRIFIFNGQKQEPVDESALEKRIQSIQAQLESIGAVDELTIQEHKETEAEFTELTAQTQDLAKAESDLRLAVKELDDKINQTFQGAFTAINQKFQEYFKLLFNGGKAELSVLYEEITENEEGEIISSTHSKTPSGIDIKATPPGKKLSTIHSLSGGERALTAIALLCSMIACFPAPIVVLDEADAALDEANTVRFGQILSSLSHKTQFVTVTHNRETMSKADILYGVTMGQDGVSKVLSIKMDQATQYAK